MISLALRKVERYIYNGKFEKQIPQAYANVKNALTLYRSIIDIADKACKKNEEGDPILFSASIDQIIQYVYNTTGSLKNKHTVTYNIALLTYHKLLKKVEIDDLPLDRKAQAVEHKKDKQNIIQFYIIPELTDELKEQIASRAKTWKENNYRIRSLSYEMLVRCEGYDVASEVYPQYKYVVSTVNGEKLKRTTSYRSDAVYEKICDYVITSINDNGYCLQADIEKDLDLKVIKINKCLPDILQSNRLYLLRASKKVKEFFGFSSKGSPNIIIPEDVYTQIALGVL